MTVWLCARLFRKAMVGHGAPSRQRPPLCWSPGMDRIGKVSLIAILLLWPSISRILPFQPSNRATLNCSRPACIVGSVPLSIVQDLVFDLIPDLGAGLVAATTATDLPSMTWIQTPDPLLSRHGIGRNARKGHPTTTPEKEGWAMSCS